VIQIWVSLPWAGPAANYGANAAGTARELQALGVSGVVQGDHPLVPEAPLPIGAMAADCLTTLTTIAAHATDLKVASLVANIGLLHPYLTLRKFAHLALLHGGERVYAGLGAGWAARDFESLGMEMPPNRDRLDRLEESVRLARELFDTGAASFHGDHVVARELPLAPSPPVPPRLLLGGGSPRLLRLAGRYADHADLAPPTGVRADNVFQQKLMTKVEDVARAAQAVRDSSLAAARPAPTTSVLVSHVVFCAAAEVQAEQQALCKNVGIAPRSLDHCPYVLIGEPSRMAAAVTAWRERIGLAWIILPSDAVGRFCTDVVPLLG
jgi:alkanesulfonate monooxygenase SsuD/methylene tetrahydromethanopterin reductase-like flavin-dependent oxidoreductase (luciferase family)